MNAYVYILFNKKNGTPYTGVTNDLIRRVYEHKGKLAESFTKRYCVDKLGYFEVFHGIAEAIKREKIIKNYTRIKKLKLIEGVNPYWRDLYDQLI